MSVMPCQRTASRFILGIVVVIFLVRIEQPGALDSAQSPDQGIALQLGRLAVCGQGSTLVTLLDSDFALLEQFLDGAFFVHADTSAGRAAAISIFGSVEAKVIGVSWVVDQLCYRVLRQFMPHSGGCVIVEALSDELARAVS